MSLLHWTYIFPASAFDFYSSVCAFVHFHFYNMCSLLSNLSEFMPHYVGLLLHHTLSLGNRGCPPNQRYKMGKNKYI